MTTSCRPDRFVATLLLLSATATFAACRPATSSETAAGRGAGSAGGSRGSSVAEPRKVRIAWDAPPVAPLGYRILVDDGVVLEIPPPSADPSCNCLAVTVPVPAGPHTIKLVAYNQNGVSPPSTVTVVQ